MYSDFVNDAIESANNYYKSADKMKHTRIVIRVINVKKISSDLYVLSLSQKLKHAETACLCIESHLIAPEWYDDFHNRYISSSLFKIVEVGDEKATVTVEIKDKLLSMFDRLQADEIKIISDLKFLMPLWTEFTSVSKI